MEGNKDEADRCINIAINAAQSGDFQKAEKFLRKADKLFPTQKAKGDYYHYLCIYLSISLSLYRSTNKY